MPAEWTAVALSPDLPAGVALPAVVDGTDLAVWRSATGRLAAWIDRCPHRGMRLSHGFVRGELLSCIYHGWRFDAAAQCRKIPAHPDLEPPAAIRATARFCTESGGLVWAALEEPAAPPPDLGSVDPLRSIQIAADARTLAECAGLAGGIGSVTLPGLTLPVTLVLQPVSETITGLHALITPAATPPQRLAASRALEALRLAAEARMEGAAA